MKRIVETIKKLNDAEKVLISNEGITDNNKIFLYIENDTTFNVITSENYYNGDTTTLLKSFSDLDGACEYYEEIIAGIINNKLKEIVATKNSLPVRIQKCKEKYTKLKGEMIMREEQYFCDECGCGIHESQHDPKTGKDLCDKCFRKKYEEQNKNNKQLLKG